MAKGKKSIPVSPPGSTNHAQRAAVIRQMVVAFPETKEGLVISTTEDAYDQAIEFFVGVVGVIRGLNPSTTRQAVEWAVAAMHVDGRLHLSKDGASWHIRAAFRNKQHAIVEVIERSRLQPQSSLSEPPRTHRRAPKRRHRPAPAV